LASHIRIASEEISRCFAGGHKQIIRESKISRKELQILKFEDLDGVK
jgi:hypothetical protein